jgi:tetratricopeptide (TPR) repeat protein
MPSRTYMVIDERRDHSFRVPRPDLSVELGTPNACNDCHTQSHETFQWAADAVRKWYGDNRADDPHWALAIAAGRAGKAEGEELLLDLLARSNTPAIIRATAIDLMAGYTSEASIAARREALDGDDALVRSTAVRALGGNQSFVADLTSKLEDPNRVVRIAAAARLAYMPREQLTDRQQRAFERAMIEFRASQELSLDHAGGQLVLAALDRQQGRFDQAMRRLRTAIRLEPYLTGARGELASLLQDLNGDEEEIQRLREEEVELMERDAKLVPDNAAIFYQLGMLRFLLEHFDAAHAAVVPASRLAPRDYEYLMVLALLHERRYELTGDERQFELALDSLKKLHELNRDDPRAAQILERLGETRRSKELSRE